MASSSPSPSPSPPRAQPEESQSELQLQTSSTAAKSVMLAIPVPTQKKPAAVPWTAEETANLIQAYQEMWYSLKKGQLKAHQWEEVTVAVAARCGYDDPTKTSTQCRHKMEKLRKRYRSEKQKLMPGGRSAWPFFDLMSRMESGPHPISARPMNMVRFPNSNNSSVKKGKSKLNSSEDEESEEDEEDEDYDNFHRKRLNSRSRSINNLLKKPASVNRFAASSTFPRTAAMMPSLRKREEVLVDSDSDPDSIDDVEDDHQEEERVRCQSRNGDGGKRLIMGLAMEMRAFAQRIAGVEKRKMEMMQETEKIRMEMENKRMKMILDSQSKMIDTINRWS